jgi:hypothetical protein
MKGTSKEVMNIKEGMKRNEQEKGMKKTERRGRVKGTSKEVVKVKEGMKRKE